MAVRAPALDKADWLNHAPLSQEDLRGKIILLDFFTYCCVNCINVLPELKALEEEFQEKLLIIGVHSGKHKHEKNETSIRQALRRYKIEHIVINDADMSLWDAFGIKAWPSLVLIDTKGYIVSQYQGEGHLSDLRSDILGVLRDEVSEHDFSVEIVKSELGLTPFAKKIHVNSDYIFISTQDTVLVCNHEGKILHTISNVDAPQGLVYVHGVLYIAEKQGHNIIKISESFTCRRIFLEGLRNPYGLESDGNNLYVSLSGAHQIKAYDLYTKEEVMVIGQENSESLHDGAFDEAVLAQPSGLSLLEDELWFVDAESSSLRCATYNKVQSHIYDNDELQHPLDIVVGKYGDGCGGGRVFIVDSYNNSLKVYHPDTQKIDVLLENLAEPSGIDKCGCHLYICNTNAHEIIIFDLSSMQAKTLILKEA